MLSGRAMAEEGSSRPASGFEHKLFHILKKHYPNLLHGELISVGTLISAKAHNKYYNELKEALSYLNLPPQIDKTILEQSIREAIKIKPERYTILEKETPQKIITTAQRIF